MPARAEYNLFGRSRNTAEAYAGSALSLLGVVAPMVRRRTVGPANGDRRLADTYPLTPLFWQVARNRTHDLPDDALAHHVGGIALVSNIRPWAPKDLPYAGITTVPVGAVRPPDEEGVKPVVFWVHGDRVMVGRIPDLNLAPIPEGGEFTWAMRFAEEGHFGAGWALGRMIVPAMDIRPGRVVPAA